MANNVNMNGVQTIQQRNAYTVLSFTSDRSSQVSRQPELKYYLSEWIMTTLQFIVKHTSPFKVDITPVAL